MRIDLAFLDLAAGRKVDRPNALSFLAGCAAYPKAIAKPHQFAQFCPQVMHESGAFRYDEELWGPTPAQARYDTRTDLGNTAAADGDGYDNRGMGPIQLTGGDNRRAFRNWCLAEGFEDVPDFVRTDALLTDPWEGLSAVWYFSTRVPAKYVTSGDFEMVTVRINGGRNGIDDRLRYLTRVSLALLGLDPAGVTAYQRSKGLKADGIVGQKTRAALHEDLKKLPALTFEGEAVTSKPGGLYRMTFGPDGSFTFTPAG